MRRSPLPGREKSGRSDRPADFYGVSTDYLLGRTQNPAPYSCARESSARQDKPHMLTAGAK